MSRKNFLLICLLIIWVVPAVFFSFCDLEISKSLVNKNADWVIFLENYGMLPGLFCILFGIFIYYSHILHTKPEALLIKEITLFLISTGIFIYILNIFTVNISGNVNFLNEHLIILIIATFILTIIILVFIKRVNKKTSHLYHNFAEVVIQTSFWGYVILIQIVKFFWGRTRFRDLGPTFSEFTPWFLPQGITGNDSFPSGHAAMGWMLLPLMILVTNKNKWIKLFVFVMICCWAIVVTLSRVVIGAHYASDVLFGSFFIIVTFFFFYKYYSFSNSK